jgi:hypothetical protein
LADEQGFDMALVLGIYEMSGRNTPVVGGVLAKYGLTSLPEAHCYLRVATDRIDLTEASCRIAAKPISEFFYEKDLEPEKSLSSKSQFTSNFSGGGFLNENQVVLFGRSVANPRGMHRRAGSTRWRRKFEVPAN